MDPIDRTILALTAGAVAAGLWLATPGFALSVGAGALLEAVNFRGLRRSAQLLFWGHVAGSRGWSGLFALRFGLLVIGIGAALAVGAHPVGLLVGLSLIMPAAVFEAWRARPPLDPSAPALAPDDESWERWNPWLAREREPAEADED
jgi:hypothetical protein